MNGQSLKNARDSWSAGDAAGAAQLIIVQLEREEVGRLAVSIMQFITDIGGWSCQAVNDLAEHAAHFESWHHCHDAFDSLRRYSLDLVETPVPAQGAAERIHCRIVIAMMENIAALLYNSTDPDDPFDEDRAEGLFVQLFRYTNLLGRDAERRAWQAIASTI